MVKFVVEDDGRATLYVDECYIGQVGRCSGMELLDCFNRLMEERRLPYRMSSDYSFVADLLKDK